MGYHLWRGFIFDGEDGQKLPFWRTAVSSCDTPGSPGQVIAPAVGRKAPIADAEAQSINLHNLN